MQTPDTQTDRQTDRQRETGDHIFRTLEVDGLDYYTSLAYTQEVKNGSKVISTELPSLLK